MGVRAIRTLLKVDANIMLSQEGIRTAAVAITAVEEVVEAIVERVIIVELQKEKQGKTATKRH